MANYDLDIQDYRATHHTMWMALTKVSAAGYRYCDRDSVDHHTVTVKDGPLGASVKLYLRQSDLYLVGFEGRNGRVFAFLDQAPPTFAERLNMSVNYAQMLEDAKTALINRDAVVNAITALSGHSGTDWNALSSPFLIMALLVSEAMRFKSIFDKMSQVVRSAAATTRFSTWHAVVTSWSAETNALHVQSKLMLKPSQYDVKTWHRFDRRRPGPAPARLAGGSRASDKSSAARPR